VGGERWGGEIWIFITVQITKWHFLLSLHRKSKQMHCFWSSIRYTFTIEIQYSSQARKYVICEDRNSAILSASLPHSACTWANSYRVHLCSWVASLLSSPKATVAVQALNRWSGLPQSAASVHNTPEISFPFPSQIITWDTDVPCNSQDNFVSHLLQTLPWLSLSYS
jgi:hypothetical protein